MNSVLRKLPLKYFIVVIQAGVCEFDCSVLSSGCVSAFLVFVSGGGGPETSERSNWTSAPSRTDPPQAMNNGHYNRKQLFCFILIMATFYLDSKNHCFVYSQSWCRLCLWETHKWDFWNKSIHPTLRQSPVSLISYFENAKRVFIVLTAEKWPVSVGRTLKEMTQHHILPQKELTIFMNKPVTTMSHRFYYTKSKQQIDGIDVCWSLFVPEL